MTADHPGGEFAGHFDGFETDVAASVFGQRRDRPCAVVEDDAARFHVATTVPAPRVAPNRAGASVRVTRFTGISMVAGGSWVERVEAADAQRRTWLEGDRSDEAARQQTISAYLALLTEATGLTRADVHVAARAGDRPIGRRTFDLEFQESGATARGGDVRAPSSDRDSPGSTMVFGPSAFNDSPLLLARTLVHEAAHVEHSRRRRELREEWIGTGPRGTWRRFLERKVRAGKISQLECDLADEPILAGNADTEVMAHLAGFLAFFGDLEEEGPVIRMTVSDDPLEQLTEQGDPAAGIVNAPLQDLDVIAQEWPSAEPSVRAEAEERLRRLYDVGLSAEEKRWFDRYVGRRFEEYRAESSGRAGDSLWGILWRFPFTPRPVQRRGRRRGRR